MYKVFDSETQNHEYRKRFASQFYHKNWVVMRGWKRQDDTRAYYKHYPKPKQSFLEIEDDITVLVGHNIKYDLLWEWPNPKLKEFFKRGGKIWCTQYAEYLLRGAEPKYHMNAMNDIAPKYGGTTKLDEVKALWDAGVLTADIDPDLLADYLIGTKQEKYNGGDIGNTEKIYLGQIEKAKKLGMLPMIEARMDGLLCTTDMEFNGLKIDMKEAKRKTFELEAELEAVETELEKALPEFPPEFEFKWSSKAHISCLIFGGALKYRKLAPYRDKKTGKWARKKAFAEWPLFNKQPVDPALCRADPLNEMYWYKNKPQDTFTSGKKKGDPKFKRVPVKGKRKMKYQWYVFDLDGFYVPKERWALKLVDARGDVIYGTGEEIIEEVAMTSDSPFLKTFLKRQNLQKDLGTYYIKYDPKKDTYSGMLTCVMPKDHIIHHNLNHTSTVTTRLSSDKPNLQNIPRADTDADGVAKSEVKKMFISRYRDGNMIEIDYSQLEIVVQGLLSGDKQLIKDICSGIDFHCKRVGLKFNIPYAKALKLCKDDTGKDYKLWKKRRTGCKEFSFQRSYGAGAPKIAMTTGMTVEEVKEMIRIEDEMYPGIVKYNAEVEAQVKKTARPFRDMTAGGKVYLRGTYKVPTGTRYSFRTYDAPDWLQDRGVDQNFKPTELKNYPVQGTGGELVQIVLGKLFRHFVKNDNYGGLAVLCNTVHDCVWADSDKKVTERVAKDMKKIMEAIPQYLKELYDMPCPVPFPVEVEIGKNMMELTHLHV